MVPMASGHLCLELSEKVEWKRFPEFANYLVGLLGAAVVNKADGVELCVWRLRMPTCELRLVYEDYPTMTSLEASSDAGDDVLRELQQTLRSKYEGV